MRRRQNQRPRRRKRRCSGRRLQGPPWRHQRPPQPPERRLGKYRQTRGARSSALVTRAPSAGSPLDPLERGEPAPRQENVQGQQHQRPHGSDRGTHRREQRNRAVANGHPAALNEEGTYQQGPTQAAAKERPHGEARDEDEPCPVVARADARVQPQTMVVEPFHALVAAPAVLHPGRGGEDAPVAAFGHLRAHSCGRWTPSCWVPK
mmetsp:Transcript_73770/g.225610  ORF Transcript_73770/g.225610 Transcript_73770/m.225610 type:complete len:206 (+) Transcript_73770:532-1149(+)